MSIVRGLATTTQASTPGAELGVWGERSYLLAAAAISSFVWGEAVTAIESHLPNSNVVSITKIDFLLHTTRLVLFYGRFKRIERKVCMAGAFESDIGLASVARKFNIIHA